MQSSATQRTYVKYECTYIQCLVCIWLVACLYFKVFIVLSYMVLSVKVKDEFEVKIETTLKSRGSPG